MSNPRRGLLVFLLALIGPLGAAPQLTAVKAPEPAELGEPQAPATLSVKPYLQALGQSQVTIRFETSAATPAQVTVAAEGDAVGCRLDAPPARLHEIAVSDLTPNTRYRYTVAAGGSEAGGAFTTWPADLSSIRFLAYGDSRSRADEHRQVAEAMARLAEGRLFILHSGDIVADGRQHPQWKGQFFDPAAPLLAQLPLLPAPGNHERASGLYPAYFTLPETEWYYSQRVGPVHITFLDGYRDLSASSDWRATGQGKWLLEDLKRAQAAPWRIAVFHTPIYSVGPHGKLDPAGKPTEAPMRFAREVLEPLLIEHGYALTLNGHDHIYERSEKDGLVMVTTGGGGAPTYNIGNAAQNPYSKIVKSVLHFMDFSADARTLAFTVYTPEGSVIDQVTLRR